MIIIIKLFYVSVLVILMVQTEHNAAKEQIPFLSKHALALIHKVLFVGTAASFAFLPAVIGNFKSLGGAVKRDKAVG